VIVEINSAMSLFAPPGGAPGSTGGEESVMQGAPRGEFLYGQAREKSIRRRMQV
jgi:hypothetical protein